MEGLETLVPQQHHTFLLTESAAAAHFNVLSFDTLFKTAATSLNHNNNNHHFLNHNNIQTTITTTVTTNSGGHPHLSLLSHSGETQSSGDENHNNCCETQTGDLNTPVTTSGDIPSFFGPSTVVEPPTITGKTLFILFLILIRFFWVLMLF